MFEDSNAKLGRRTPIDRIIVDTVEQRDEAEPEDWKHDSFVQKLANKITPDQKLPHANPAMAIN